MSQSELTKPVLAITMGDVAGVGPEVVAATVTSDDTLGSCSPLVVGDADVLARACQLRGVSSHVQEVSGIDEFREHLHSTPAGKVIFCWNPSDAAAAEVPQGKLDARAGAAAYDWLIAATDAALDGTIDAIVTAPLNKAALHLAGHHYPGHTEILAERCGVDDFAMMLYLPAGDVVHGDHGLGVAHVTLHTSIASVPQLLSTSGIEEKIQLMQTFLRRIGCERPRIGVCALNPHAGEQGLFGDEESTLIAPAVQSAMGQGIEARGPFPADTLMQQAVSGAYDGVVAMYHDQGHIALKLIAFQRAVNVTLGLPIVRTSPSHGTAFDIAWKNQVQTAGMQSAIRIALRLAEHQASV